MFYRQFQSKVDTPLCLRNPSIPIRHTGAAHEDIVVRTASAQWFLVGWFSFKADHVLVLSKAGPWSFDHKLSILFSRYIHRS